MTDQASDGDELAGLRRIADLSVEGWRFKWGDLKGPEDPDFDDSGWQVVDTSFRWFPPDSNAWYRRWIEIPRRIGGLEVRGSRVYMVFQVDDDAVLYCNGKEPERFHGRGPSVTLTDSAEPGERFLIAIKNINRAGHGQLISAELRSESSDVLVERVRGYLAQYDEIQRLVLVGSVGSSRQVSSRRSIDMADLGTLSEGDSAGFMSSLDRAQEELTKVLESIGKMARRTEKVVEGRMSDLDALLGEAEGKGLDCSYPTVSRTVAENFLRFSAEDLGTGASDKVVRASGIMDYLLSSVNRAIAEVGGYLAQPQSSPRVPRYKTGPVEIKDGALFQGETPVFLTGFGHFGQVRNDIPVFPAYGFNAIQVVISALRGRPDPQDEARGISPVRHRPSHIEEDHQGVS
jgi:hypothetical protein